MPVRADLKILEPAFAIPDVKVKTAVEYQGWAPLTILCALMERGEFTKYPFGADGINHRLLQPLLYEKKDEKLLISLNDSMFSNNPEVKFDMNQSHGVFIHSIVETDEASKRNETVSLRSNSKLQSSVGGNEKHHFAKNRDVVLLKKIDFERLLNIFGYTLPTLCIKKDHYVVDDVGVHAKYIVAFFNLFNGYDFGTDVGFKKFLKDFGLEVYYVYNDDLDIYDNNANFARLLRHLVPVRISMCDGQHRMVMFALFMNGIFVINTVVPLLKKVQEDKGKPFQLWKNFKFSIGVALVDRSSSPSKDGTSTQHYVTDDNVKSCVHTLRNLGDIITKGSYVNIAMSWKEVFDAIQSGFQVDENIWGSALGPVAGSQQNPKLNPFIAHCHNFLDKMKTSCFPDNEDTKMRFVEIMLNATGIAVPPRQRDLEKALVLPKPLWSGAGLEPRGKFPIECCHVLNLFRACFSTDLGTNALSRFYGTLSSSCPHPQRYPVKTLNAITGFITHPDWIRQNASSAVEALTKHFSKKFSTEQFLIDGIRGMNYDEAFEKYFIKNSDKAVLDISDAVIQQFQQKAEIPGPRAMLGHKDGGSVRKLFNLPSCGTLVDRYECALALSIYTDIITTITDFGFDPNFTHSALNVDWLNVIENDDDDSVPEEQKQLHKKYFDDRKTAEKNVIDKLVKQRQTCAVNVKNKYDFLIPKKGCPPFALCTPCLKVPKVGPNEVDVLGTRHDESFDGSSIYDHEDANNFYKFIKDEKDVDLSVRIDDEQESIAMGGDEDDEDFFVRTQSNVLFRSYLT